MRFGTLAVAIGIVGAGLGCAHSKSEPTTPTPSISPVAGGSGQAARTAGGAGGAAAGGAPRPANRRGPPNWELQDSVRRASVAEILLQVAGRENEPAGKVFKNVKLNKDMPVTEFLTMMDEQYGRGLGIVCTGCHMSKIVDGKPLVNYASDERKDKAIARQMEKMQQATNRALAKVSELDDDYPKSTCVMCHRGTAHMPNTMKALKNTDLPPVTRK